LKIENSTATKFHMVMHTEIISQQQFNRSQRNLTRSSTMPS